jgi:hypothetical protein
VIGNRRVTIWSRECEPSAELGGPQRVGSFTIE